MRMMCCRGVPSTWAVVNTVSVCSPGCKSASFAVDWPCRKLSRSLPVMRNLPQCDLQCPRSYVEMWTAPDNPHSCIRCFSEGAHTPVHERHSLVDGSLCLILIAEGYRHAC